MTCKDSFRESRRQSKKLMPSQTSGMGSNIYQDAISGGYIVDKSIDLSYNEEEKNTSGKSTLRPIKEEDENKKPIQTPEEPGNSLMDS